MLILFFVPVVLSIIRILIFDLTIEPLQEVYIWEQQKSNAIFWTREEEKNAIAELKAVASDIIPEDELYAADYFLWRWLRARDLNVMAAKKMAYESREWRIRNNMKSILNETILTFSTSPYEISGHDMEGRPLLFFTPKHMEISKIILHGKLQNAIRYFDQMLESGYHAVKYSKHFLTNGEPVTNFVSIVDMGGLTVRQHLCLKCFSFYLQCAEHFELYYPGLAHLIVIINMNRFAMPIVELVLPVLTPPTRNALKYFGTNRTEWSKYLLSIISQDQLPYLLR